MTYSLAGQTVAVHVTGDPISSNNGFFFVISDHLGSTSVIANSSGQLVDKTYYLPFGSYRRGDSSILTESGFTSHLHNDDLGLTYMNARFYSPVTARFISADTIVPDPTNPQTYNRYSYVHNSPLNFTDPTGFWDCASGDDYQRCVDWVTDLLEMLKNDGGDVAYGVYLWFMAYDQSLIAAGGTGVVFEITDPGVVTQVTGLFNFDMQAKGTDTIQIMQSFFNKAVDHRKAALLGHEITHLFQGGGVGLSELGEISAYNVQATILMEFQTHRARLGLPIDPKLDLGPNLQTIYDTIQGANEAFSANELANLRNGLTGVDAGYSILPVSPALIGFNNHPSDYSLVVEPIRVFTNLAYMDAIMPNGVDKGVR